MKGKARGSQGLTLLLLALTVLLLLPATAEKEGKKLELEVVTFVTEKEDAKVTWFYRERRYIIEGRFTAATKEGVLKADRGEYDEKGKVLVAEGNVLFYDERNRGTAKRVRINFDQKKAALEDEVRLKILPRERKEREGEGEKEGEKAGPAIVTCQRIIYWYEEKRAITEGKVNLEQERIREGEKVVIRIAAERAEYKTEERSGKKEEVVVLEGKVRFEDSEGNYLACDRLVYSLTEEWLEAEGKVEARFRREEEKKSGGQK